MIGFETIGNATITVFDDQPLITTYDNLWNLMISGSTPMNISNF